MSYMYIQSVAYVMFLLASEDIISGYVIISSGLESVPNINVTLDNLSAERDAYIVMQV